MNAQPELTPEQRLRDMCSVAGVPVRPCYKASSIASIIGVSPRSINRLHSSGQLANFRLSGTYNRYTDWHALELFVDGQPQPTAEDRLKRMCQISGIAVKGSYDTQSIATILGIHSRQVYNLLNAECLPAFHVHNHRRVAWPSLVDFIAR